MEDDINPNVPVKKSFDKIYLYIIIVVLCLLVFYFAWLAFGKAATSPPKQTNTYVENAKAMAEDIKKQLEETEETQPESKPEPEQEPVSEPKQEPQVETKPVTSETQEEVN